MIVIAAKLSWVAWAFFALSPLMGGSSLLKYGRKVDYRTIEAGNRFRLVLMVKTRRLDDVSWPKLGGFVGCQGVLEPPS